MLKEDIRGVVSLDIMGAYNTSPCFLLKLLCPKNTSYRALKTSVLSYLPLAVHISMLGLQAPFLRFARFF